jgi:hypothetical protein
LLHAHSQSLDQLAHSRRTAERLDGLDESSERDVGNFVASELSEKLLLSREIEILVGDDGVLWRRDRKGKYKSRRMETAGSQRFDRSTHPNRAHVLRDSIGRNPLVIFGLEDVALVLGIREPLPQSLDLRLKVVGLQELVREGDESEVEEGGDDTGFETSGLGETIPEAVEVGGEGVLEVGERGGADVVADDEEEECLVLRPVKRTVRRNESELRWKRGRGIELGAAHVPATLPFSLAARKRARLTSKTVLSSPMLAPW